MTTSLNEWIAKIKSQSLDDDLALIDSLYGRENLPDDATPEDVKREALSQAERDHAYVKTMTSGRFAGA